MVISSLWQGCAGSAASQLEAELSSEPGTDRKGLFCFAQWLLRSCPTAEQRAQQGTSQALRGSSLAVLPWDAQPDPRDSLAHEIQVATGDTLFPVPGQRLITWRAYVISPGSPRATHEPISACKPPRQERRAGHSVISLLLAAARPSGGSPQQGHEDQKPVQWVHKPHSQAEQRAAGA